MFGYELLTKLADGSAAEVFLAKEESTQNRRILEVLRPELLNDDGVYGRFLDEAKQRQTFDHPNLVRRERFGCGEDGRIYAVTEPLRGDHLGRRLKAGGRLSPLELCGIMVPICDALSYLHQRGVVHGALRPSCIYVDPARTQVPKLLDTGLSLLRTNNPHVTASGTLLVEPEYLAPERIGGQRGDALSDVYGLGVLMFELLTGEPPFKAAEASATRLMHFSSRLPKMPDTCAALEPIVSRCVAKKRRDRYPDVASVKKALREVLESVAAIGNERSEDTLLLDEQVEDDDEPLDVEVDTSELTQKIGAPGVGSTLGSYFLEKELGKGGMAHVFLARHRRLGRHFAVKVLQADQAADPVQLQRFFQEARALNGVESPHLVRVLDLVEEPPSAGGHVYLVMEALEGQTLKELAAAEKLPVERAVRLISQLCDALTAAHRVGVIHRDIKPANIFVTTGDLVKVLDFGVAKLLTGDAEAMQMTRTGLIVGTPAFMAPEQACAETVDHRADIYATGAVLYSLITGRLPFEGTTVMQILGQLLTRNAPPLPARSQTGEPIGDGLRSAVAKCLERNAEKRFSSTAQLKHALMDTLQP